MTTEKKYIIYARVSSERQRNNTSIESQIEICVSYVSRLPAAKGERHRLFPDPTGDGISPYVFSDVESAGDVENEIYEHIIAGTVKRFFERNRPELWRAIQECIRYKCNLVVAYVDRLSRQVVIENIINAIFAENGIEVFCADVNSALERNIKSLLSQEENRQRRNKIIEGVKRAKRTVEETGFYPNGTPCKFFTKDGLPRYGGPAPADNKAALASAAVRTEKMKQSNKYKAAEYLMGLFAEQDFFRLQLRLKNLELCRKYGYSFLKLRESGFAVSYDTPLSVPDMVYLANVYAPEWATWLQTKSRKPYTANELYAMVRRQVEEEDGRFVRVKIREALYNGSNIKYCLIKSEYKQQKRTGDGIKRVVNAFFLRKEDYEAMLATGEDAFYRIIASHEKSGQHKDRHTLLPAVAQQKILSKEVLETALNT